MSKRTKIVATVGPSTSSEEVLKAMIKDISKFYIILNYNKRYTAYFYLPTIM